MNRQRDLPPLQRHPTMTPKATMRRAAPLALLMLLPTACAHRAPPPLVVAPMEPVCPETIVLAASMTDPVKLPTWLPYPDPITTLSPATASASLKCIRMPKP